MRVAIVSDIHGNLIALEAVLADLQQTATGLIFHGGDVSTWMVKSRGGLGWFSDF